MGIFAIVSKPSGPEILLQKQYRPPIDKVVIEVPAGLIDEGETPRECAVRELKEETGFVGVAEEVSPVMYNGTFSNPTSFLSNPVQSARMDELFSLFHFLPNFSVCL